jgi:hypothetical protein
MPAGTGGQPPWEYVEYLLCTEFYHCLPSQLREEEWDRIRAHLECRAIENDVAEKKRRARRA